MRKHRADRAVSRAAWTVAMFLTAAVGSAALAQTPYRLTIFAPQGDAFFQAQDVNNAGQLVGYLSDSNGSTSLMWHDGALTSLGSWRALAINNNGQVVGETRDAAGLAHAVQSSPSGFAPLTTGTEQSSALDINDRGQIVGFVQSNFATPEQAAVWDGGNVTFLGQGYAFGINNAGQTVGISSSTSGSRAALWDRGGLVLLGGLFAEARGINDLGQIVGGEAGHAHLWDGANSVDLGALSGLFSHAEAINNSGQVVGAYQADTFSHAALWNGAVGTDLNDLLRPEAVAAGWVLSQAQGINNNGWIVGTAYNRNRCPDGCGGYGFLLTMSDLPDQVVNISTPVPEPSTYALLMVGLGAVVMRWRRRQR